MKITATLICVLILTAMTCLATTVAAAAPQPKVVTDSWQLDIELGKPALVSIARADTGYDWYWYLPYTVTNRSGQDQIFIPQAVVSSDRGDIITANESIPTRVYDRIRELLGRKLLESPSQIVGTLRQGADHARESVFIWPYFEDDVDEMTLFISGLSGEVAMITHPLTGEPEMLNRTLMLVYETPGNPRRPQRQEDAVRLQRSLDVMR